MSQKWDIYFCGSIRGGRQDAELYRTIIGKLKSYGTVLTEFVGTITDADAFQANGDSHKTSDKEIYERDMRLLDQCEAIANLNKIPTTSWAYGTHSQVYRTKVVATSSSSDGQAVTDKSSPTEGSAICDALIAEVTQPSLGVGFEISRAVTLNKPLLCLYRPSAGKCLSSLVRGIDNGEMFNVVDYKEDELDGILADFFEKVRIIKEKSKSADSTEVTYS